MVGSDRKRRLGSALALLRRATTVAAATALVLQLRAGIVQAAAVACQPAPATATSVQGSVETKRAGESRWRAVKLNDTFCPGDVIRVLEHSRADVMLLDQSVLRLNANASITVEAPKARRKGVIDLLRGAVHFFARGPNSLEVNTPFTVAGVRGTEFLVTVEPKRTLLSVFEGTVVAQNRFGSLTLSNGQSATAEAGKAPALRIVLHPRDAVQWTFYYPPVVYFRPGEVPTGARLHAYRAQRLLAVGSVHEARAQIAHALQLSPNDADTLSLQAVMTLVQGEKDRAFEIAKRAVSVAPNSATARLALSYTQQARFDLSDARASVQYAVKLEPRNALAWARLAELDSSLGERQKATAAARRAAKLQPDLSLTQTVLGFAQLISIDIGPAEKSFERAIALDQADPLPRLGLGLAKIRAGDLNAGSRDLEIAASLDPGDSLVRSYLGKSYYEQKRTRRAEREFGVAEKLDPKDPTPWFYDAIAKQTTNRPVEALQDLEKAQQLNDNRAVYRSKLLLDSDAAARAASQARIYSELGFQQRALVEGWLAVNRDPTSFSAHRFLADSYSVLPNHEIARVSELLQSQLLAPVTNTPLQPRLAESNLMLISSGGPGVASFNEFNPLFNRDGASLLLSGMLAGHDTAAGDVVLAGIAGRASYSFGYSRFNTDGFRVNADQHDDIGNAFVQYDLTPDTSVQAEYRHRKVEWGDLQQRFFADAFSTSLRNMEDSDTYRLGARHAFSPSSMLLGSFIYQERNTTAKLSQPPNFVFGIPGVDAHVGIPERATGAELEHFYRSDRFNLRTGVGYFDDDRTQNVDQTLTLPLPSPPFPPGTTAPPITLPTDVTKAHVKHTNVYSYGTILLQQNVNVILGASYDSIHGDLASETKSQFNPKLGLIWNVTPTTTIRAAGFRVLKRTLVTNQTLEPTEVAGFNQFYDDANFTESKRYGVAVDQKFSSAIFGGLEAAKRDLTVPWTCVNPVCGALGAREADWQEKLLRGYVFWTPHPWWALRAEYIFEQFKRDAAFTGGTARDLDSYRVPFGVRFFHPSGYGASLTATYWKQTGDFGDNNSFQSGSDRFWTVDAALSYRLPRRMGFVSVGATNLLNKQFRYMDTDLANPTVLPTRMAFVRLTLLFP